MGMRSVVILGLVFAAGLGIGGAAAHFFFASPHTQRVDDSSAGRPASRRVAARGRLEPEGGIVNLAAPGPDVVQKIDVHDGDEVEQNQQLAVLGSRKMRDLERQAAEAQLADAADAQKKALDHLLAQLKESDAHVAQLRKQAPRDVEIQNAKIKVLDRQLATARDLYSRMQKAGGYPQQELDQQKLLRDQAEQELEGARAVLVKIKDASDAAIQAAEAQRDVVAADLKRAKSPASLASLEKNVDLAKARLESTIVQSPIKGKVLKVLVREGELVGTQPVFQLADTRSMVAVAEVYETDVKAVRDWVRTGQRVEVDVEIRFPGGAAAKFRGQVVRVADLVARNSNLSIDPRQDVDRRVVEVRIRLDSAFQREAAEYVNMQVDVTIRDPKAPNAE